MELSRSLSGALTCLLMLFAIVMGSVLLSILADMCLQSLTTEAPLRFMGRAKVQNLPILLTWLCPAQVYDAVIDGACPQKKPFEVVRCTAHQHVGSQCMYLYNLDTDDLICKSCPVYGTQPGESALRHSFP